MSCVVAEDSEGSQSESENSDSIEDNDDSVAEISRSFLSRQELCEQLNINHMIQRIFLITLDNSECRKFDRSVLGLLHRVSYSFRTPFSIGVAA